MSFGIPYSVGIVGALRILDGDIPYRDFWTMYAPGHFYLLALLFYVFGKKLLLASAARAVFVAASASVFFLIARELKVTRHVAVASAGLFVLMLWRPAVGLGSYEPALFFIFLAWLVFVRNGEAQDSRAALTAGASLGVAAWFKHDIAAYAGIAMGVAQTFEYLGSSRPRRWLEIARGPLLIAAGAAATIAPVALWCWAVAGRDAWQDVVRFPATDFPKLRRRMQYPGFLPDVSQMKGVRSTIETAAEWVRFNVPLLLCLGWSVALVSGRIRRTAPAGKRLAPLLVAFVLFWLAAHIRISTHIWTMSAIALLLGGVGWSTTRARMTGPVRVAATAVAMTYAASLLIEPAQAAVQIARQWRASRLSSIPSLQGLIVPADDLSYYEPLAELVRRSIPEHERIYVGVRRHDALVASNAMVYAVIGRRGASRYDELHPAIADRPEVQREIIDGIERNRVRLAVVWELGRSDRLLNAVKADRQRLLPGTGATVLDAFLAREFRPVGHFGEYLIRWRVDAPDP
jgi:hypothetical protein